VDVLNKNWFSRTWIIQEIVCSKNAKFMMGSFTVSWDSCIAACNVAHALGYVDRFSMHDNARYLIRLAKLRDQYWTIHHMLQLDPKEFTKDPEKMMEFIQCQISRSITQILPLAVYRKATDPRDKVFAMLNIAAKTTQEDLDRFLSIIDYDSPVRTVYIRTCEIWHLGGQSQYNNHEPGQSAAEISFLDWVLDPKESEKINLPTWVPHWMQGGPAGMLFATGCQAALLKDGTGPKAHVIFPSSEQHLQSEVPLSIRGIKLFSIHQVCSATGRSPELNPKYAEILS
jgi:hypothetical protein